MPRTSLNVNELQVVAEDIVTSVVLALSVEGRMNDQLVKNLAKTNRVEPDVIRQLIPSFPLGRTPSFEQVRSAQMALYKNAGINTDNLSEIK